MAWILVVEDDPPQQRLMHDLLEDEGHEIRMAATLEEAITECEQHRYDLLVTDLMLAKGMIPLADLTQAHRGAVLVVSAHPARAAYAERADIVILSKPYDIKVLVETVARLTS